MARRSARAAVLAAGLLALSRARGETPLAAPCDGPAAVTTIAAGRPAEAFAVDTSGTVTVVSVPDAGPTARSILRVSSGTTPPKELPLGGRLTGLALSRDGRVAYAAVRTLDKKGAIRSVDLVRIDVASTRAVPTVPLPSTAAGLALAPDESGLLVACKDEIRTFRLPQLTSGPLYRVPGDNVGVAPLSGSRVLVAQRDRLVIADFADTQDRMGLPLAEQQKLPDPLRAAMASAGPRGPVLIVENGSLLCASLDAIPPEPTPVASAPSAAEAPPAAAAAAVAAQTVEKTPEPTSAPPPAAAAPESAPASPVPASPPPLAREPQPTSPPPAAPSSDNAGSDVPGGVVGGTQAFHDLGLSHVNGQLTGAARAEATAVVFLGPDSILREARRVAPDAGGRFATSGLPDGTYRLLPAGQGGRVLICNPSFVTIHVKAGSTVEAPVIEVVQAPETQGGRRP